MYNLILYQTTNYNKKFKNKIFIIANIYKDGTIKL